MKRHHAWLTTGNAYIMLFDAATLPANDATPKVLIYVPPNSFGWETDAQTLGTAGSFRKGELRRIHAQSHLRC
ncbi:MAG TPA: hypothetical protein VKV28_11530 [Candidatus Binataceae bacterium]|nr:hypothetical protein [Candidatus Binataceae bacterium]